MFFVFLKAAVVLLFACTLYRQLGPGDGAAGKWEIFLSGLRAGRWELFLPALVLMPLNWALEGQKLRWFAAPFFRMPFRMSLRTVLAGLALGFITPGRIGDYGGRLLAVPRPHHWNVIIATLVSNFCQLIVLISTGTAGLAYYAIHYLPALRPLARWLLPATAPLVVLLALGLYRLPWLLDLARRHLRWKLWTKALERLEPLTLFPARQLSGGLALAACRYLVYSLQYFLLLRAFGVTAPVEAALSGISALFLLQTSLPLPPLFGVVARSEAALLIWSPFGANEFSLLAATLGLFIINLALPALLGLYFVVKINILNSLAYEESSVPDGDADGSRDPSHGVE